MFKSAMAFAVLLSVLLSFVLIFTFTVMSLFYMLLDGAPFSFSVFIEDYWSIFPWQEGALLILLVVPIITIMRFFFHLALKLFGVSLHRSRSDD